MKQGLILTLFVSLHSYSLVAQDNMVVKYFPNGKISGKGHYDSYGAKKGLWIEGELDADNKYYYQEGNYTGYGDKDSTWRYYNGTGELLFTEIYKGGSYKYKVGINTLYDYTGKITEKGKMVNGYGYKDSIWITYFSNGIKSSEIYYHNDRYDGKYIEYYSNGQIRDSGCYRQSFIDKKTIPITFHNTRRIDTSVSEYKDTSEVRIGIWKEYYEYGQLRSVGSYFPCRFYIDIGVDTVADENGNLVVVKSGGELFFKDGLWKYYNESGKLTREELWENCRLKKRDEKY
ncbi:MAG TPA: hypothetical protein VK809_08265 [Bacteroidia bacterium]|jgi:antitoxin component YwqK of YwqJK toxin-antitoxin module|nr:hypothetical protein [Bacteroidia bacterium]